MKNLEWAALLGCLASFALRTYVDCTTTNFDSNPETQGGRRQQHAARRVLDRSVAGADAARDPSRDRAGGEDLVPRVRARARARPASRPVDSEDVEPNTEYSLLQVLLVLPVEQHVSEMGCPSSPVMSGLNPKSQIRSGEDGMKGLSRVSQGRINYLGRAFAHRHEKIAVSCLRYHTDLIGP